MKHLLFPPFGASHRASGWLCLHPVKHPSLICLGEVEVMKLCFTVKAVYKILCHQSIHNHLHRKQALRAYGTLFSA